MQCVGCLLIGLIIGLFAGAVLPPIFQAQPQLPAGPGGARHTEGERLEEMQKENEESQQENAEEQENAPDHGENAEENESGERETNEEESGESSGG